MLVQEMGNKQYAILNGEKFYLQSHNRIVAFYDEHRQVLRIADGYEELEECLNEWLFEYVYISYDKIRDELKHYEKSFNVHNAIGTIIRVYKYHHL